MRSGRCLYKLPPTCVAFRQSANQVSLGITVAATMRCKCACAHMPMVAHEHSVMCVTVTVTIWKAMTAPGVEPGLSRPQRDVLTTRRCGRNSSVRMHGYLIAETPLVPRDTGMSKTPEPSGVISMSCVPRPLQVHVCAPLWHVSG